MKNITPKLASGILHLGLLIALCLASPGQAQPGAGNAAPLSSKEMEAVLHEIQAMVKTEESQADKFSVRVATPERIDRLFRMPEFQKQSTSMRENGLIFAGRGSLMTFDKPSDILAKVSAWFPQEIAAAQAKNETDIGNLPSLYGPYPSWPDESAAFLTLWHCMPGRAWLRPTQAFFMRRLKEGSGDPYMAIGDRSSGAFDFGDCVQNRSNRVAVRTDAEFAIVKQDRRKIGDRVKPVLQRKFARFLAANRCRGTGPDDCVLVLLLWSSLAPADPGLAKAIQTLEPEIAPDSPLPALNKPLAQYESSGQEGEARFDEALRKTAFLRAKELSVLNAQQAWPAQALPTTLHQISGLLQKITQADNFRWSYYRLDSYMDLVTTVSSPSAGSSPRVQAAVLAELESLVNSPSCEVLAAWIKGGGKALQNTFALRHVSDQPPLRCVGPDWEWMRLGETEEARSFRSRYIGLLGKVESGVVQETILSQFTDRGNLCFDRKGSASQEWLREPCERWITEPQAVSFALGHSRLTLSNDKKFQSTTLKVPPTANTDPAATAAWLTGLARELNGDARKKMQTFVGYLNQRKATVQTAIWWRHPHQGKSLVELQLAVQESSSYQTPRVLLVFDAATLAVAEVPQRFFDDYDSSNGSEARREIVQVSDLDGDGNLEVWWSGSFQQCSGDNSDLQRNIDCTAKVAQMGEIRTDSLTYFVNTSSGKKPSGQDNPVFPRALLAAAETPVTDQTSRADQTCNTALVARALQSRVAIDFGIGQADAGRGDVIDLVCKAHPLRPELTIVALFHELRDQPADSAESKKGFVLAVIDARWGKLISLYRDNIEEDATTRIMGGSLWIDTARYNLAPGVRALGVRMNIGYSPRFAEGGENNYLTLFVEEGMGLRPVLKNMPMSIWRLMNDGQSACGSDNEGCAVDNVELMLSIAPTSTEGWHDLDVVAHHKTEGADPGSDKTTQAPPKAQALGRLRAKGKMYSGVSPWSFTSTP